jgi:hypothetical protein
MTDGKRDARKMAQPISACFRATPMAAMPITSSQRFRIEEGYKLDLGAVRTEKLTTKS